ncbi:carbonic anhydrase 3-like [Melitaea cinxia]|uniref:carbonic anhydrase 3-like n=1 Tax=Melitaea cinxia TaxID=113334 RepID=UPI001E272F05|nr:carbonic anhydrase 3-like [Melitaea cinxia]
MKSALKELELHHNELDKWHKYASFTRTQDQTTTHPNTLFDDADDIQRQLDNEARDKIMLGKPKTVWVFRLPTEFPQGSTYSLPRCARRLVNQNQWHKLYPQCGGRSQSPVDLPAFGLIKAKGRHLRFINYDNIPRRLTLSKNGKQIVLYGEWEYCHQPLVYGGAAHSRRYVFHSMILHYHSEHRIGGLQYPLETQVLHISAEFRTLEEALASSSRDHQALLVIVNLYKFKNHTHRGIEEFLNVANSSLGINTSITPRDLAFFNPPLKEYVCYQGSLTYPPCTETVLWLVRARALPVTREIIKIAANLFEDDVKGSFIRQPQPLNDRKVFYFN